MNDMAYAYNPDGAWTSTHQMSINGKFDGIGKKDLMTFADENGIRNASALIEEICEKASGWKSIALECGIPGTMAEAIFKNFQL